MQIMPSIRAPYRIRARVSAVLRGALLVAAPLCTTGCTVTLAPLARHTAAFSDASGIVVDRSVDAYRAAMRLDEQERIAEAAAAYSGDASWNPYTALGTPLLTPEQLGARIKVLHGLKVYSELLAHLTDSKKQYTGLSTAAISAGSGLESLGAAATPELQKLFPSLTAMTDTEAKGVGAALNILGQLLINNQVRKGLKATTAEMNPNVEALCKLIDSDVKILRREADRDYQTLLTSNNQFIKNNTIDPVLRRQQVVGLLDLVSRQQANDVRLDKLQKALVALSLTHQALAAEAQGNNPEAVQQHVVDLASLGQELGSL